MAAVQSPPIITDTHTGTHTETQHNGRQRHHGWRHHTIRESNSRGGYEGDSPVGHADGRGPGHKHHHHSHTDFIPNTTFDHSHTLSLTRTHTPAAGRVLTLRVLLLTGCRCSPSSRHTKAACPTYTHLHRYDNVHKEPRMPNVTTTRTWLTLTTEQPACNADSAAAEERRTRVCTHTYMHTHTQKHENKHGQSHKVIRDTCTLPHSDTYQSPRRAEGSSGWLSADRDAHGRVVTWVTRIASCTHSDTHTRAHARAHTHTHTYLQIYISSPGAGVASWRGLRGKRGEVPKVVGTLVGLTRNVAG